MSVRYSSITNTTTTALGSQSAVAHVRNAGFIDLLGICLQNLSQTLASSVSLLQVLWKLEAILTNLKRTTRKIKDQPTACDFLWKGQWVHNAGIFCSVYDTKDINDFVQDLVWRFVFRKNKHFPPSSDYLWIWMFRTWNIWTPLV